MKRCTVCNRHVEDDVQVCPNCGFSEWADAVDDEMPDAQHESLTAPSDNTEDGASAPAGDGAFPFTTAPLVPDGGYTPGVKPAPLPDITQRQGSFIAEEGATVEQSQVVDQPVGAAPADDDLSTQGAPVSAGLDAAQRQGSFIAEQGATVTQAQVTGGPAIIGGTHVQYRTETCTICRKDFPELLLVQCLVCGKLVCTGDCSQPHGTGRICVSCVKRGYAVCSVCDTPKRHTQVRACPQCGQMVCDDDACWCDAYFPAVCVKCARPEYPCPVFGCHRVVALADTRTCPQCGRQVCDECMPPDAGMCRECLVAHQKPSRLPRVAIPVGRCCAVFDTSDMQPLAMIDLPHSPRSVDVAQYHGEQVLLCGWREGVYLIHPLEGTICREFTVTGHTLRRGFNSATIFGDHLYAGHRELGLCRWPLDSGDCEVGVWARRLGIEGAYVSCLQVTESGSLWFTAGSQVFEYTGEDEPVPRGQFGDEIWRLAVTDDSYAVMLGVCDDPAKAGCWAVWDRAGGTEPVATGNEPLAGSIVTADVAGVSAVAMVSVDGDIHLLDSGKQWQAAGHVNLPQVRCVGAAGRYLAIAARASGDASTSIVIWDVAAGGPLRDITDREKRLALPGKMASIALMP